MTRSRHLKHTGRSPTRAGFTTPSTGRPWPLADHPRSRGVHLVMLSRSISSAGSSPLARGLLRHHRAGQDRLRIIPARAGFTQRWRSSSPGPWDHPRSRGVYERIRAAAGPGFGSSPLARGLPGRGVRHEGRHRIIPARAGFTAHDVPALLVLPDHPRSRGVYTCGSLESQRRATLPDRVYLHC